MNLNLSHQIICRTPALPLSAKIEHHWDQLMAMIAESSPDLFEKISPLKITDVMEDAKLKFTITKYFNRAKYRATPFGNFAAVTALALRPGVSTLRISTRSNAVYFRDWKDKNTLTDNLPNNTSDLYQLNSTIYRCGTELRYIHLQEEQFQLDSIEATPLLDTIMEICRERVSGQHIIKHLKTRHRIPKKAIPGLLHELVTNSLLQKETQPNIIGRDYFERVANGSASGNTPYIICRRDLISGSAGDSALKDLPALAAFLAKHVPPAVSPDLEVFRERFIAKFGNTSVPLSVVMDPEIGIGYGFLGATVSESRLNDLFGPGEHQAARPQLSAKLHTFLLRGIVSGAEIDLDKFISGEVETPVLPNTLSVLLHVWQGKAMINSIGGCTANALIGRFTTADSSILEIAKELAATEAAANPGVGFFDIGYQAETKVDNVNRREKIYPHELPILTWSEDPDHLTSADILVHVSGKDILLWSEKLQKRVVPRIATAYNYGRSDLALYRFLCDLQHQGIHSSLGLELPRFFEGLEYYPRVVYRNTIISPAQWLLNKEQGFTDQDPDSLCKLREWLSGMGVTGLFQVGNTDQKMCFSVNSDDDLTAFLRYRQTKKEEDLIIREALIEGDAIGEHGERYAAQYVVPLTHQQQIYYPYRAPGQQKICSAGRLGGQWLFAEIYCHPLRSDDLLTGKISAFITRNVRWLDNWFFIRYFDPTPHIRLRLKLKDPHHWGKMVSALTDQLAEETAAGSVADIQLKQYRPETVRYRADRMNAVEDIFCTDSNYVLKLKLSCGKYDDVLTAITLRNLEDTVINAFYDIKEALAFSEAMAANFTTEFGLGHSNFKKINAYYGQIIDDAEHRPRTIWPTFNMVQKKIIAITSGCTCPKDKWALLADLLHMHINRVYAQDQRRHEAVLYHMLVKLLRKRIALRSSSKGMRTAI